MGEASAIILIKIKYELSFGLIFSNNSLSGISSFLLRAIRLTHGCLCEPDFMVCIRNLSLNPPKLCFILQDAFLNAHGTYP